MSKASLPVFVLLAAAILGMVSLHVYPLLHPWIFDDDFTLFTDAWDWPTTRQNLWAPFNDNVCPMERLAPFGLVRLAGRITAFPRVASLQGPIALALALTRMFVSRTILMSDAGELAVELQSRCRFQLPARP